MDLLRRVRMFKNLEARFVGRVFVLVVGLLEKMILGSYLSRLM